MIINKLILEDYTRMKSNNFNRIVYTPSDYVQIILGTNGFGKSSLLYELSPLPADLNKHYGDNGYKQIHITHNDKEYICTSDAKMHKHSFIVDAVELNNGGTRKVQLELVEEHFQLTIDIHNVLLGTSTFTNMSVANRKKWFRRIASVDYAYGLKLFDKVKTQYRDMVGSIRTSNERLTTMSNSVLDEDVVTSLINERDRLNELVEYLYTIKSNNVLQHTDVISLDKIDIVKNKLMSYDDTVLNTTSHSVELAISKTVDRFNNVCNKLNDVLKALETTEADKSNASTITDIDIDSLKLRVQDMSEAISGIVLVENIGRVSNVLESYVNSYVEDVGVLKKDDVISKDVFDQYVINIATKKNSIIENGIKLNRQDAINTVLIAKSKDSVECPKCSNVWSIGYDKGNHKIVQDNIIKLKGVIDSDTDYIDKVTPKVELYGDIQTSIVNIRTLLSQLPEDTYSYIMKDVDIHKDIHILDRRVKSVLNKLLYVKDLVKLENKLQVGIKVLEASVKNKTIDELSVDISNLKTEYVNLSTVKHRLRERIELFKRLSSDILDRNNMAKVIEDYNESIEVNNKNEYDMLRNEYIDLIINEVKINLGRLNTDISKHDFNVNSMTSIKSDIEKMKIDKISLGVIMDALSPTKGLIGESVSGYLDYFTKKINIVINSLWSYRLNILPCNIDKGDLDYRFPFDSDGKVSGHDVSIMSTSMKEVVNLAFKLVSMEELKLTDYPLYLDEYAASFDQQHRLNAYDNIDAIKSNYSQVFIISHYSEIFTRFENSDIVVIAKDNLFLDNVKKYNTNIQYW